MRVMKTSFHTQNLSTREMRMIIPILPVEIVWNQWPKNSWINSDCFWETTVPLLPLSKPNSIENYFIARNHCKHQRLLWNLQNRDSQIEENCIVSTNTWFSSQVATMEWKFKCKKESENHVRKHNVPVKSTKPRAFQTSVARG